MKIITMSFSKSFPKLIFILILPLIMGTTLLTFALISLRQPHQGPIAPIAAGYGSWGSHDTMTSTFSMDVDGDSNTVTIYYPSDQMSPAPVLFFAVGWNMPCASYDELLYFLVSKGYTAVCDEYTTNTATIGSQLANVFTRTADLYPTRIDKNKFGLIGHSSGGGLLTSVSYTMIREYGFGGTDGENAFLFFSAPWIDFDSTDVMLADYPSDVKMIVQTYENDCGTDYRTYIDQFESVGTIADTAKEYVILRPSSANGYDYAADHRVIATGNGGYGTFDAMDDYGVFRLIDALADYTFNGSESGRLIALGDGSDQQIEMGALNDLISTDDPRPIPGQSSDYPCDIGGNPRKDHCDDYDNELPASVLITPSKHISQDGDSFAVTWEAITTAVQYEFQLYAVNSDGTYNWGHDYGQSEVTAVAAHCENATQNCSYTVSTALPKGEYAWWIRAKTDAISGAWSRPAHFFIEAREVYLPIIVK